MFKLPDSFDRALPADEDKIASACAAISNGLPADLQEFYRSSNGAEGFVGDQFVRIYPITLLASLNLTARIQHFVPSVTLFGSSGGGEAYVVSCSGRVRYLQIPFIPLSLKYAKDLAGTFEDLLDALGGRGWRSRPQRPANPKLIGHEIHEIQPVIFGGDPVDPKNKDLVSIDTYMQLIAWWNDQYRNAAGEDA